MIHLYPKLSEEITSSNIVSNKDYTIESLIEDINIKKSEGVINKRLIFVLDNTFKTSKNNLEELFENLKDYDITFVSFNSSFDEFNNVKVIPFYNEMGDTSLFYNDKTNLNDSGLEKLKSILLTNLNE